MRYRVDDLPAVGVGAFTPLPATNPVASSYGLVGITATWGTDPAAAPAPVALPSLTAAGKAPNTAQGHSVSPDSILPAIAVASTAHMGPERDTGIGMARRRLTELPFPALNPARVPMPAQTPPVIGGRAVLGWPRAFQTWPIRGSS